MTRQAWLVLAAIGCLMAQGAPRGQASKTPPIPTLVGGAVPSYPTLALQAKLSGSVVLNVATDGERVTKVDVVEPSPLLGPAAQRDVATWVFAPHTPTSFRMKVDFEIHPLEFIDPASCFPREKLEVVTYDLPTRVQVIGRPELICDMVEPVTKVVADHLRRHPSEPGWVATPTRIPTYPMEALKAGVEGVVVIRVAPGVTPVAVEGHRLLASAATDFAKTWQTSSKKGEPFDVRINYRLVEGDCAGGGPRVVLNLPREIGITAKRIIPCGGG